MSPALSSYTLEDQERMARAENYFAWQHRLVRNEIGRRVIEIGCGIGNFTRLILDREAVLALDAEPGCIQRLQQRFPDQPNLRVIEIGCGIGNFTRLILDREAVLALDAEPGCIQRLQQRFPDQPNLRAV